ncbi:hypothetical protein [Aeromonas veronii]|uniref:hypothetical protein n=1 Tax=Aeromonas veronii TaxID=654 RepID=UPI001F198910|nr:hypothetical protein [Aeromonas veronii]MCF5844239.1 hypothetical protein [Aeromonas veronii]
MIKVEKLTTQPIKGHSNVVFASKQDADEKDMSRAIGRFDDKRREIALLTGTTLGNKYKALIDSGFQLFLKRDNRNNFYIAQVEDAINHLKPSSYSDFSMQESMKDNEEEQDSAVAISKSEDERPDLLEYIEADEFMREYNDSAMDLDFTTKALKYEHRVGLYNEDEQVFTLREDVKDLLEEFSFHIDENEEGVLARIDPASLNARALFKLVNLLKRQEQEDDEDLQEAIDSRKVNVHALSQVRSLLKRLSLAQRHGDIEASEEAEQELEEIIQRYEQANPPALGIDELRDEIDEIISQGEDDELEETQARSSKPRKSQAGSKSSQSSSKSRKPQSRSQRVGSAVDKEVSKHSKTYRHAKKIYKSASNIANSFKKESDITESILAQSGIQIRGQQESMSYVY